MLLSPARHFQDCLGPEQQGSGRSAAILAHDRSSPVKGCQLLLRGPARSSEQLHSPFPVTVPSRTPYCHRQIGSENGLNYTCADAFHQLDFHQGRRHASENVAQEVLNRRHLLS
jgi:hypothetical protein